MTEAGASSRAKQVVGAGSLISLLYRSRVYYLPITYMGARCVISLLYRSRGIISLVCGCKVYYLLIILGVLYPYCVGAGSSISLLYGIYVPIA